MLDMVTGKGIDAPIKAGKETEPKRCVPSLPRWDNFCLNDGVSNMTNNASFFILCSFHFIDVFDTLFLMLLSF